MSPELVELLKKSKDLLERMTPDQKEAMFRAQRESWVRGEMAWPKAKYKWINGAKVYDSYEDYVND
jgi:hypothetical protein